MSKIIDLLVEALAALWYRLDPRHREIVRRNLAFAYGEELSAAERERLAREVFVSYVRFAWEMMILLLAPLSYLKKQVLIYCLMRGWVLSWVHFYRALSATSYFVRVCVLMCKGHHINDGIFSANKSCVHRSVQHSVYLMLVILRRFQAFFDAQAESCSQALIASRSAVSLRPDGLYRQPLVHRLLYVAAGASEPVTIDGGH